MTRHLPTLAKYAALLVAAVLTLGPVWWTFTTSLRPAAESFSLPPSFFPLQPDFSSYAAVFEQIKIPLLVLNSALVTALIAVGQMLTAAMAGYVFARMEFRARGLLFAIVPVFMIIRGIGLSDTLLALILPAVPTAFGTFLMRQYFLGLPLELGEAAAIDGASPWRTFFSIYAPLALPGMAIVGVLAFNTHWNEFFRPLIFMISEENYTLPLGLVTLQGNLGTGSISIVLAGVIL